MMIDILLGIATVVTFVYCVVMGYIQISQAIDKYKRNR